MLISVLGILIQVNHGLLFLLQDTITFKQLDYHHTLSRYLVLRDTAAQLVQLNESWAVETASKQEQKSEMIIMD
jgi:hypothetical protein